VHCSGIAAGNFGQRFASGAALQHLCALEAGQFRFASEPHAASLCTITAGTGTLFDQLTLELSNASGASGGGNA